MNPSYIHLYIYIININNQGNCKELVITLQNSLTAHKQMKGFYLDNRIN